MRDLSHSSYVRCTMYVPTQAEREFWTALEFRVCAEMEKEPAFRRLHLWCDGFGADNYHVGQSPSYITGTAWIGSDGQDIWKFSLILPYTPSSLSDINWSELLPSRGAKEWLIVDLEKKEIEIRLDQSKSMRVYQYVGPKDIAQSVADAPGGALILSGVEVTQWICETHQEPDADGMFIATFVIDDDGLLRIADRRSEHV